MTRERVPVVVAFAVLMGFGWWVTAQEPFSAAGTVGVLVAGLALIIFATVWRRRAVSADAVPPTIAHATTTTPPGRGE